MKDDEAVEGINVCMITIYILELHLQEYYDFFSY